MPNTTRRDEPSKPWPYHALVRLTETTDLHRTVSLYADNLDEAKLAFEAKYGSENVVSVWGEFEAHQER